MKDDIFRLAEPNISENLLLRIPQIVGYKKVQEHFQTSSEKEICLILPTACGKSGLAALIPFAVKAKRALIISPSVLISEQLNSNFDYYKSFYKRFDVLNKEPFPISAEIRGELTDTYDLDNADAVITNIQQLNMNNELFVKLPIDYFDLIIFDEGHHNVADSWQIIRETFPNTKIINLTATPMRSDGRHISGKIIYRYTIREAINEGYLKELKALMIKPKRVIYFADNQKVSVKDDDIRIQGEIDADFRRRIVTLEKTRNSIIDVSIQELNRLRSITNEPKLKIIACARDYNHCFDIVDAYREKGLRADFIHTNENEDDNREILRKLDNHELDVIIQVRKLGEGFDHKYLSVAAVFGVFGSISTFIQFVGRIMRAIEQNSAGHPLNFGSVVFHLGGYGARRWEEFQTFSEGSQNVSNNVDSLTEEMDIIKNDDDTIEELTEEDGGDIKQYNVSIEEIPLEANIPRTILKFTPMDIRINDTNRIDEKKWRNYKMQLENYNDFKKELKIWIEVFLSRYNLKGIYLDKNKENKKRKTNRKIIQDAFYKFAFSMVNRTSPNRQGLSTDEMEFIYENFEEIFERIKVQILEDKIQNLLSISLKEEVENYKKHLRKLNGDKRE